MSQSPFFTLAFWLILLPALWASGSLAGFRLREKNPLFSGVLTLGFGLGVYACFLILAGSFGWLNPGAVFCFLALSLAFGWRTGTGVFLWLRDMFRLFGESRDIFSRICQLSLLGTFFFTALFCFLPEIANDALAIQLYASKLFVRNASIAPSFYDLASYRPLLMSVLYSTGLLFQNVAISKFFHWFCGVLLVGALAVKVGEATQNRKLALFFSLMLWLTPTLMNQITTTYIDAGVALFVFLGFCVVIDALEDLEAVPLFYGGLLIGLAVAARSLAFGAFFAIMVMLGLRLFRRGIKTRVIVAGVCFALGVFLSSAYWFLRDWLYTGNPVYPFLGTLFGTEDISFFSSIYFHGMGLTRSPGSFLMIPWDITFKPRYFDYHHWIGPFYLSVLPFFLYAGIKIKKAKRYFQFVIFFTVFWYFTGQNVRYLLPSLPVYLVAAAMGLRESFGGVLQMRWGRLLAKTAAGFAIASLLSLTAYHYRYQFMPLLGIWSGKEYLPKMERTIPAAEWVNAKLPQDAKVLIQGEVRFFYFDRDVVWGDVVHLRERIADITSLEAIAGILKKIGVTHILDAEEIPRDGDPNASQSVKHAFGMLLKDGRFIRPVVTIQSSNILGPRYQYRLYELV